jgi:predicted flap endonuclease-1-like 5' DNA nuclease
MATDPTTLEVADAASATPTEVSAPPPAPSTSLLDRLRELAVLKTIKAQCDTEKKIAEAEYRRAEAAVAAQMLAEGVDRVHIRGVGSFAAGSTNWLRISDFAQLARWAVEHGFLDHCLVEPDAEQVTMTFDLETEADDKDPERDRIVLVNGMFRVDVRKKILNEHVNELTRAGQPHPPGVEPSITTYVTIRRDH